ncbi:hypothetical protein ACFPOA_10680 [Lysobacter niabensis]|uniref:hypothetical protein n=1 Tax=Agrilutibacter niabensis TaxID=380628 RepID=UPI00361E37EA
MPATIASHHHHFHFTVPGAHISAKAVLGAGLLAGAVYFVLEMLMARFVLGVSPWVPARMIAAVTQGSVVLPPPFTFDLSVTIAAVIQHAVLSLVYAFIFAFFAKGRSILAATLLGAGYGLLLYAINFYGFTELFPWFAAARNWGTVSTHLIFGAVLGGTYAWLAPHEAHPAT